MQNGKTILNIGISPETNMRLKCYHFWFHLKCQLFEMQTFEIKGLTVPG